MVDGYECAADNEPLSPNTKLNEGMAICSLGTRSVEGHVRRLMDSISAFYPDTHIFFSTDSSVAKFLHSRYSGLKLTIVSDLDKYGPISRPSMTREGTWLPFQMEKANILELALRSGNASGGALYVDSDTVFLGSLPAFGPEILALSPHLITAANEKAFGKFNGGYVFVRSPEVLALWRRLANTSDSACCADQMSLQDLTEAFQYSTMHPGVNVGWYQVVGTHNLEKQHLFGMLLCHNGIMKFKEHVLYSVHFHTNNFPMAKQLQIELRKCSNAMANFILQMDGR